MKQTRRMSELKVVGVGLCCFDFRIQGYDGTPGEVPLLVADSAGVAVGGPTAASLAAFAQFGASVKLVSAIGDDQLGRILERMILEKGIDARPLIRIKKRGVTTAGTAVLEPTTETRYFVHAAAALSHLTAANIPGSIFKGAGIAHFAGTELMARLRGRPCAKIVRMASDAGCQTSWDTVNPGKDYAGGLGFDFVRWALPNLDLFMTSLDDAEPLFETTNWKKIVRMLVEHGMKGIIVVKMGSKGMIVAPPEESPFHVPAFKLPKPKGTTACGDSASAAFAASIWQGETPLNAALLSNAIGWHVAKNGVGVNGVPKRTPAQEFVRKNRKKIKVETIEL